LQFRYTVKLVLGDHLSISRHVVAQNRWSFNRGFLIWLVNQSITDLRRFKYSIIHLVQTTQ